MIIFLGAGGGGVAGITVTLLAGGGADADASGGGVFVTTCCCPWGESVLRAACACSRRGFSACLTVIPGSGLSGATWAAGAGEGGEDAALAEASPTCRLLITVFTPATDAACSPAASRCAVLSTAPESVTTPLLACTVSCFEARPESWLKRL